MRWRYLLASLASVVLSIVPAGLAWAQDGVECRPGTHCAPHPVGKPCIRCIPDAPPPPRIIVVDWQNSGFQDGTAAHPYRTLPPALAAAAPGYTIAIRTGSYGLDGGPLVFNKPGTVRADNGLVTIPKYGNIEYFGYYGDVFRDVGKGDYIAETAAAGANLSWIGNSWALTELPQKLAEAKQAGSKVVLLPEGLLNGASLASDWQAKWTKLAAVVKAGWEDTVVAFYPQDEPYKDKDRNTMNAMRDSLVTIANRIHQDFPAKAVAAILDVPSLGNLGPDYVSMFDWVGFDCYKTWEACNMPVLIQTLRSWLNHEQRMIAVPWACSGECGPHIDASQQTLDGVINHWQQEVLSDNKYIAVVPYIWQTADSWKGTEYLPLIKHRLRQVAQTLLHHRSP